MKKIIALVFFFLFIPFYLLAAMTPGYGGPSAIQDDSRYNCIIWREGMPLTAESGTFYCSQKADIQMNKRFYELEVAVQALEMKVASCESATAMPNKETEARLTTIETNINSLQNNIMNSLKSILLLIINKK